MQFKDIESKNSMNFDEDKKVIKSSRNLRKGENHSYEQLEDVAPGSGKKDSKNLDLGTLLSPKGVGKMNSSRQDKNLI